MVAPSGECLRGEGVVWLIGAVVCSLAAAAGPSVRQHVQRTGALVLQHHWLLLINCHFDDYKVQLVRFPCKMRYIKIPGFSFRSH